MNIKKTKYIKFGTKYRIENFIKQSIILNGNPLDEVTNYKYLGTFLDSELNFVRQANETIKIVNHKLYCITKIKPYISSSMMLQLYKSYIQPLFDYNDIFLENTHVRLKTKLINLRSRDAVSVVVSQTIESMISM